MSHSFGFGRCRSGSDLSFWCACMALFGAILTYSRDIHAPIRAKSQNRQLRLLGSGISDGGNPSITKLTSGELKKDVETRTPIADLLKFDKSLVCRSNYLDRRQCGFMIGGSQIETEINRHSELFFSIVFHNFLSVSGCLFFVQAAADFRFYVFVNFLLLLDVVTVLRIQKVSDIVDIIAV